MNEILPVHEQGVHWGHTRLRQEGGHEVTHIDLRRNNDSWKTFASFVVYEGKIAFRMYGSSTREGVYDPATNTITVAGSSPMKLVPRPEGGNG